jgi:hypothetical protein
MSKKSHEEYSHNFNVFDLREVRNTWQSTWEGTFKEKVSEGCSTDPQNRVKAFNEFIQKIRKKIISRLLEVF